MDMVHPTTSPVPPPPWKELRERLLGRADDIADGDPAGAAVLRALVESWWEDQEEWNAALIEELRLHHDINNALVGISGNAQLLLLSPVAQQPALRERLEVVLRESTRIEYAARRLRALKSAFEHDGNGGHHAVARTA
jgi:hypothetical protein